MNAFRQSTPKSTSVSISPAMIRDLRHLLAQAIASAKAYDVPGLCRRLNLADGNEQEAFASKYKYAQKRLGEVSAERVIASGRQRVAEEDHFELTCRPQSGSASGQLQGHRRRRRFQSTKSIQSPLNGRCLSQLVLLRINKMQPVTVFRVLANSEKEAA